MSDTIKAAVFTAVLNAAVTWGIMSTKLDWLRADMQKIESRVQALEQRR